jgi:2-keto-4-pentenoate hydratase
MTTEPPKPPRPWAPDDFAATLATARGAGLALRAFPGAAPSTLPEAYEAQAAAIDAWAGDIVGWKVGRIADFAKQELAEDRFIGPIFAETVRQVGDGPAYFDVITGGTAALEVEFVARLRTDADPGRTYDADEVSLLIDDVFLGIEVAGSPVPGLNSLPPLSSIAAFGNNLGLILGPSVGDWSRERLNTLACSATIDGLVVGSGGAGDVPGGIATAIAFALNKAASLGRQLKTGALISTGAVTGIHPVRVGQSLEARFGDTGRIDAAAIALDPRALASPFKRQDCQTAFKTGPDSV